MFLKQPRIGQNISNNIHFLKKLSRTKSERKRRRLLRNATSSELLSIIESALNIVRARFKLTARQKNRIIPHIAFLRRLSRIRSEIGARGLVQKGNGFVFPAILTPIIIEVLRQIIQK